MERPCGQNQVWEPRENIVNLLKRRCSGRPTASCMSMVTATINVIDPRKRRINTENDGMVKVALTASEQSFPHNNLHTACNKRGGSHSEFFYYRRAQITLVHNVRT